MSFDVVLLVLFGAFLHAGWNASVKSGTEKSLDAAMIALGSGLVGLACLPFLPPPDLRAVPFLLGSAVLQFVYFQLVAAAYRAGDIGLVYPLMRGGAPLIVAAASQVLVGEALTPGALAGVAAISGGVFTLTFEARHGNARAIALSLANAVVIAGYTFVDGIGARLSGNPVSYTLWMALLPPVLLLSWAASQRGVRTVTAYIAAHWLRGLLGGMASIGSYGLALWAMTRAPVASVAALRETSILFAIVLSIIVLREPVSKIRILAAALIALGALLLKLG